MKPRKRAFVLAGLSTALLLAPVLIWSGKRIVDTTIGGTSAKLPEVSTVGPETAPYVLTPLEREKLALPAYSSPSSLDIPDTSPIPAVVAGDGPYEGMTQAELDKLAAWRSGRIKALDGTPARTVPERGLEGGNGHE